MKITIFNTDIKIKEKFCSLNGCKPSTIKTPYVNVYVRLTNHCNANCEFCEFHDNKCVFEFDPYKMYFALSEVRKVVKINKVSFTGGETTINMDLLNTAVELVKKIDPQIFTVVHTNGFRLAELDNNSDIDNISMSFHHYDWGRNQRILRSGHNPKIDVENFKDKKKIHFSCNLLKKGINCQDEMIMYLERAASLGIRDVGFVSLMKVNKYCENNFIDFSSIQIDDSVLTKTRDWNMSECCKGANYLYLTRSGDMVKVYSRYYLAPDNKAGNLVYDINCLKDGFNGEVIFE